MDNDFIDLLIALRRSVTTARGDDEQPCESLDLIDALLSRVEPGKRPDVDALLGRRTNSDVTIP